MTSNKFTSALLTLSMILNEITMAENSLNYMILIKAGRQCDFPLQLSPNSR